MQKSLEKSLSLYPIDINLRNIVPDLKLLGMNQKLVDNLAGAVKGLSDETFSAVLSSDDKNWSTALVSVKPGKYYSTAGRGQLEISGLIQRHCGVEYYSRSVDWTSSNKILLKTIREEINRIAAKPLYKNSEWPELIREGENIFIPNNRVNKFSNLIDDDIQSIARVIVSLQFGDLDCSQNNIKIPFDTNLSFSKSGENRYKVIADIHNVGSVDLFEIYSETYPNPFYYRKNEILPFDPINFTSQHMVRFIKQSIISLCCKSMLVARTNSIHAFLATLDQEVMLELSAMGVKQANAHYNWIMKGSTSKTKERRWQALKAAPVLISSCITSPQRDNEFTRFEIDPQSSYFKSINAFNLKDMEKTVDEAKELIPFFANRLGVSPRFIREIGVVKTDIDRVSQMLKDSLEKLISIGELLPNNSVPKQLDEWKKFFIFLSISRHLLNPKTSSINIDNRKFLEKEANWLWQKKTLLSQSIESVENFTKECYRITGIGDFAASFARQCIFPIILDSLVKHSLKIDWSDLSLALRVPYKGALILEHMLVRDRTLAQLLEMSEYWHKHQQKIETKAVGVDQSWPALFEPLETNGLQAIALCSSEELEAEGKAMNHCVATYVRCCLWETSHIISLRDQSGNRISTMEVRITEDEDEEYIEIAQHLSVKNSQPSEQARFAAESIVEGISSGNIGVKWHEIKEALSIRKKEQGAQKIAGLVGYDIRLLESREQVFAAWSFTQPSNFKNRYQEWINQTGLIEMVDYIVQEQEQSTFHLQETIAKLDF